MNVNDITHRVECSIKYVRKWIRRWQEKGEEGLKDKRKKHHGLRSITTEQDEALVMQVDEDPFFPVSHSVNLLDLQISKSTARRRLNERNVHSYHPALKILLTDQFRDDRFAFALHQFNTASSEDWGLSIWTDECNIFNLI